MVASGNFSQLANLRIAIEISWMFPLKMVDLSIVMLVYQKVNELSIACTWYGTVWSTFT